MAPRAHAAAAGDHDRLARPHLGAVNGRAEAGGDAAADQRGRLHVVPRVDAHQRVLVAHHLVGERAELGHAVQVLAAQVVAEGAIADHAAGQRRHPEVTEVLAPRGTPVAGAAGGDEGDGHVVALGDLGDVRAHLGHDPRALVSPDDREHGLDPDHLEHLGRCADVTRTQVLVGVAHACVDHLDPDLAVARGVDLDLFGLPRLVEPGAHRRTRRRHGNPSLRLGPLPEASANQFAPSVSPPDPGADKRDPHATTGPARGRR